MCLDMETRPNKELLRKTLATIKANPEHWDQSTWRCETGMCFAGWSAHLAGGRWISPAENLQRSHLLVSEPKDDLLCPSNECRPVSVLYRAQRLLGLAFHQAADLFASTNTMEDLERIVAELCNDTTCTACESKFDADADETVCPDCFEHVATGMNTHSVPVNAS
jgi:hypothetical protein